MGNEWAMSQYGKCLAEGIGVKANPAEAVKWFIKGAEGGNTWCKMQVAKFYLTGFGVEKDESMSRRWLDKVEAAAEKDLGDGIHMLSEFYRDGYKGLGKDPARAFKYAQMAADRKWCWGYRHLARCHAEGVGTPRDVAKARECLNKALEECGKDSKFKPEIENELKKLK